MIFSFQPILSYSSFFLILHLFLLMMIFPYVMLQTLQAAGRGVQPLPIGVHLQPSQQQFVAYSPSQQQSVVYNPSQQLLVFYNPF